MSYNGEINNALILNTESTQLTGNYETREQDTSGKNALFTTLVGATLHFPSMVPESIGNIASSLVIPGTYIIDHWQR